MTNEPDELEPVDMGGLVFDACENGDLATAEKILRSSMLYVMHQVSNEEEEEEDYEEDGLSLVVAESDGEVALMCFTATDHVDTFMQTLNEELPDEFEIPLIAMDGVTLLSGLPDDMGLLINAGTELEAYIPPGALQGEGADEEE